MDNDVTEVRIKSVIPASGGCAVFLGPKDKTFVIHIDQFIGRILSMAMDNEKRARPLTHDLIGNVLAGLGAQLERMIINDVDDSTFYARLILKMENELGTKIIELDARPSDSMVLAIQAKKPILVAHKVLDAQDDMTDILKKIQKKQEE